MTHKKIRGQVDRRSFPGAHVQDGGIHGDLISAHTSHCLRGGIQGRSFVISQNLEPTAQCLCGAAAVAENISSSCCTAGDRGPPKAQPRRQPIFSPPSSKLLRANAIPDWVQHQLYLPQTRSYLSRLPDSAKFERASSEGRV